MDEYIKSADGAPAMPPPSEAPAARPYGMYVPSISTRIKPQTAEPSRTAAMQSPPAPPRLPGKWRMEMPLIPTTLDPGSYNRFARAAALTVVDSPGMICNPLLVFGAPGCGKTHFVNFIAYALSAVAGLGGIFVTDGIKFSKGIDLAVKDGSIGLLDETMAGVKALVIDDVHLMMISETNRGYIRKWLGDFVAQGRQLVLASGFPPRSMAGLEEAVGFHFAQGWTVDLKTPSAQEYKVILSQLARSLGIKIPEGELADIFFSRRMSLGDAVKTMETLKKLERLAGSRLKGVTHARLLELLLGPEGTDGAAGLTEEDARAASSWRSAAADGRFRWGIFHPEGMRREAMFALYSLRERAKELGLDVGWEQVFVEEYAPDGLYAGMFRIGNFASERNVNGAIVLAAAPPPAGQEADLRHIALKILESFRVKGAWLPVSELKSGAAYAKMLMALI